MLEDGKSCHDQKKCDDYKKWDNFCYWYRWDLAHKCDYPEYGHKIINWSKRDSF